MVWPNPESVRAVAKSRCVGHCLFAQDCGLNSAAVIPAAHGISSYLMHWKAPVHWRFRLERSLRRWKLTSLTALGCGMAVLSASLRSHARRKNPRQRNARLARNVQRAHRAAGASASGCCRRRRSYVHMIGVGPFITIPGLMRGHGRTQAILGWVAGL